MAVYWVNKQADTFPPKIAAKARAAAAAHDKMFKTALRIGVPIAFGTDAGVYPHGMNAHGIRPDDRPGHGARRRRCSPARAMPRSCSGVEAEVGTLEAGKVADVVAVPGNVLSDIHATEHPCSSCTWARSWCRRPAAEAKAVTFDGGGPVQYTARPAAAPALARRVRSTSGCSSAW